MTEDSKQTTVSAPDRAVMPRRRRTVLWGGLERGTSALYNRVIRSWLGRILTSYRAVENRVYRGRREAGRDRCSPVSAMRLRTVDALESGRVIALLHRVFSALFDAPLRCYGVFGLCCSLFGIVLYFAVPYIDSALTVSWTHLLCYMAIFAVSVPLTLSPKPLRRVLGEGCIMRRCLTGGLGIPSERLARADRGAVKPRPVWFFVSVLLAIPAASFSYLTHPFVVPLVGVLVAVVGMIFAYPEAGVILSTSMLPLIWLDRRFMLVLAIAILLTWISYIHKLLFLHRTMRMGLLDWTVLVFGAFLLISCFTGAAVTTDTVVYTGLIVLFLSDYFLIVNLMTTRAHITRCLGGVLSSVVLVTILCYVRMIPVDALSWLEGSRAGDLLVDAFTSGMGALSGLWAVHSELFLVITFPWLYAFLLHTKRLLRTLGLTLLMMANVLLVIISHADSTLLCIVICSCLFFLLYSHKALAVGTLAVPALGCAYVWADYLFPSSALLAWDWFAAKTPAQDSLRQSVWRMIADHPFGIGMGSDSFADVYPSYASAGLTFAANAGNLYLDILLSHGWCGLLLLALVLFLFVQKSFSCIRHAAAKSSRALILGGLGSVVSVLILGTVRSFSGIPRVFFTLLLAVALCSAYENILFEEHDVLTVDPAGDHTREDRMYRTGM